MGIKDVIETQEGLLKKWTSDTGQNIVIAYAKETGTPAETAYAKVTRELAQADPVLVTAEICDLIEFGERSFPQKFTLKKEDIPLHFGFAKFERPLWLPTIPDPLKEGFKDVPNGVISLAYVAWGMTKFQDIETKDIHDAVWYTFYLPNPLSDHQFGMYHSSGWMIGSNEDWSFNHPRRKNLDTSPEFLRALDLSARYLMSFFRFISTKVIEGKRERIHNKQVRRRIQAGLLKRVPDVHVVRLRKVEYSSDCADNEESRNPKDVHWSHRWPVGAHWHNYYYPTKNEHRPVWVDAYVKGPGDKPLIVKKRAIKVDR